MTKSCTAKPQTVWRCIFCRQTAQNFFFLLKVFVFCLLGLFLVYVIFEVEEEPCICEKESIVSDFHSYRGDYKICVRCDGKEYWLSDMELYSKYNGRLGDAVVGVFEVTEYSIMGTKMRLIDIQEKEQ